MTDTQHTAPRKDEQQGRRSRSRTAARAELARRAAARSRFAKFSEYIAPDEPPAAHHRLICDACDDVLAGKLRRLLIFMPPGSAKSTYASVRFPAYFLGRMPHKSIIAASYGEDLPTEFGRRVRNIVAGDEYPRIFPGTVLSADSRAAGQWATTLGGGYYAAGVGTGITGRRADLGLIDDPVKGRVAADSEPAREGIWAWYRSDFIPRLKPGAAQTIIQTRWHQSDLAGRILGPKWAGESGDIVGFDGQVWRVICLQAQAEAGDPLGREPGQWLWPEWFSGEFWEETKAIQEATDTRNWQSLYQQTPQPEQGTYFRREWFQRYDERPERLNLYLTTDAAVSDNRGDFTELAVWGVDAVANLYAVDWWSGQVTMDVWIDRLLDLYALWTPDQAWGESGVIRNAMEPFLKKRAEERRIYPYFEWITRSTDKAAMARSFQARASMGKVYFPKTPWADRVVNQLVGFPAGTHDDAVDACALIGRALDETRSAYVPKSNKVVPMDRWARLFARQRGRSYNHWKSL